jgi:single-stranded-DNA-specific exonuclease
MSAQHGFPPAFARVLLARGLVVDRAIEVFLNPRLGTLSDPMELPGIAAAVERLWRAVDCGERIVIFGDFDCDGITSSALLQKLLMSMGANVAVFLPDRLTEGYGFSSDALRRCIALNRPSLIVTVDCGTNDVESVELAHELGAEVIVTDHHEVSEDPASPFAMVNSRQFKAQEVSSLAGVGVVFKLCHALLRAGRDAGRENALSFDLREYLGWVAIGTVADVVPLVGENRVIVRYGLDRLRAVGCPGLAALMDVAKVGDEIDTYKVAFMIAPRINAAGRMGRAADALELLLTDDLDRARVLAETLDTENTRRKKVEDGVLAEAELQVKDCFDPVADWAVVVSGKGWHQGVLGIVASRLARKYNRPSVVVGFDEDGQGRGSCRSIQGCSLVDALGRGAEFLKSYGGHEMAAGLSIGEQDMAGFRMRFLEVCKDMLRGINLSPTLRLDALVRLDEVDDCLFEALRSMRPFGEGNRTPLLGARGVRVVGEPKIMKGAHLKMNLAAGSAQLPAIAFGMGDRPISDGPLDVAFTVDRNTYGGRSEIQLKIRDFGPAS